MPLAPLSKENETAPVPELPELDSVTGLAHGVEVELGTTLMLWEFAQTFVTVTGFAAFPVGV